MDLALMEKFRILGGKLEFFTSFLKHGPNRPIANRACGDVFL